MTNTGEIVTIHSGEAGINVGNATWELYCLEHGIKPDGSLCKQDDLNSTVNFFTVSSSGKFIPRAIFIDTDSSVVDDVRTSEFRFLYNPKNLISGKEDTSNCFAKGYLTLGREMVDVLRERIRSVAEECSRVQGFMVYRAVGGGTGSGLTCYLLEQLVQDYKKKSMLEICVYPAPKLSSVIVEPYNATLATDSALDTIDCCLTFENDALYDICSRILEPSTPSMTNLNRIASLVASAITAQFRFEGTSMNLAGFYTNLIPFPRIHFPLVGHSPFTTPDKAQFEHFTISSLTHASFEPINQMVRCNNLKGQYVSCCLLYRGDVSNAEVQAMVSTLKMKKSIQFVSWVPTKFKVGLNYSPPVAPPGEEIAPVDRGCTVIANNSAIRQAWEKVNRKFDMLFAKKAFVHWYLMEGLEESDFMESRMNMEALVQEYNELESEL